MMVVLVGGGVPQFCVCGGGAGLLGGSVGGRCKDFATDFGGGGVSGICCWLSGAVWLA